MTAIAALWQARPAADLQAACAAMLSAQAIYGPDAADLRLVDDVAVGRALFRLLPEDVDDAQPVAGGDGRFMMAADVRLDDRDGLLAKLRLSRRPAAALPDAALLMAAWERWGEDMFPYLIGDYALAVFDRRDRRLTIARDPLGQRPLFWTRATGRVAVASMPKGLHALGLPRRPDVERVARLLGWTLVGERGFYADVQRVEPGHLVRLDREGVHVRRHWRPRMDRLVLPRFDDYVDAYREQIDRATAARLRRTDDAVAAQLSGGWDSSTVVATAARQLAPGPVIAYTSVPGGGRASPAEPRNRFSDEGPLAAAVAAMYPNVDHVQVPGTGGSPIARLDADLAVFDRPMVNLCNHVWLADIRRRARAAGARVLLTGEIGNYTISSAPTTMLADYVRAGRWIDWAREATGTLRDGRARVRGVLATSFGPWVPRPLWRRLAHLGSAPPAADWLPLSPEWRRRLADEIASEDKAARSRDYYARTLAGIRGLDFGEYHKGVLGGWGIDKRDPTADVRVVEFMLSLPPEMFLKDGVRRPLARAALADRLPPAVLAEKRKGYQAADWHAGMTEDLPAIRALVDRIGADPVAREVVDIVAVRKLVKDWPDGNWTDPWTVARYRNGLLLALSAGHFLLAA